jgi:hypothetical protein
VGFVCVMFMGVELGLAASIGVSLLTVVLEAAFPNVAMLGQVEKTSTYRSALLPAARCPLPAACCPLPAARCPLPAARCPLPAARCLLPAASCLLPPACCLLPAGFCSGCLLPAACCLRAFA